MRSDLQYGRGKAEGNMNSMATGVSRLEADEQMAADFTG